MKIVDELLERIETAKLRGETQVLATFPESVCPWALKELNDIYNIHGKYQSRDNTQKEPQITYIIEF